MTREADLRIATGDALTQLVLESPSNELLPALDNPALDENHILLILRRVDISDSFIRDIVQRPQWSSSYPIKAAVSLHPHTPRELSMNFVKFLFWRDLAKILNSYQVPPAVRRMAEVNLRDRMQEISLGERISLARMAPREVIKVLRHDRNERILGALLDNPRTTEDDLLVLANSARTPPNILSLLAHSQRWASRQQLRLALARNPRLPVKSALPLLKGMVERDLLGLLELPTSPTPIRAAAARLVRLRRQTGQAT